MSQSNTPMVSVAMITYNHEKFIKKAIESVLMQETTFDYELIIANDCSTDQTHIIIENLIQSHPKSNLIRYFNHKTNLGMMQNAIFTLEKCDGKYIANCEGDDFWTDSRKLQKQVDFLEANDDFAICFHNVEEKYEDEKKESFFYCQPNQKEISELEDLLELCNFIPTCSAVYRKIESFNIPSELQNLAMGDWISHIVNAQYGKIKYLNEVMGVHRIHDGGIWSKNKQITNLNYVFEAYHRLKNYFKHNLKARKLAEDAEKKYILLILNEYFNLKDKKNYLLFFVKFAFKSPKTVLRTRPLKNLLKITLK